MNIQYPHQSVWESLEESFLIAELDEITKYIGIEILDENDKLWTELLTLTDIAKDLHSFDYSTQEITNYNLSTEESVRSISASPVEKSSHFRIESCEMLWTTAITVLGNFISA